VSSDADSVLAVDDLRKRYDDTVALDGVDLADRVVALRREVTDALGR
jgi:hypothetical protein